MAPQAGEDSHKTPFQHVLLFRLHTPSSLRVSWHIRYCSLLTNRDSPLDLLQSVSVFPTLGSPRGPQRPQTEGSNHFSWPANTLSLTQPGMLLVFTTTRAHCWFMYNLLFTRTPWSCSAKLLSNQPAHVREIVLSHMQGFAFAFVELREVSGSCFPSSLRVPPSSSPALQHINGFPPASSHPRTHWGCSQPRQSLISKYRHSPAQKHY